MGYHGVIREQDPLKQGLKLGIFDAHWVDDRIREQDPLKQGLKRDAGEGRRRTL